MWWFVINDLQKLGRGEDQVHYLMRLRAVLADEQETADNL